MSQKKVGTDAPKTVRVGKLTLKNAKDFKAGVNTYGDVAQGRKTLMWKDGNCDTYGFVGSLDQPGTERRTN